MLVSYKWLNEYVDIQNISPVALANQMSLTGIEIEDVTSIGEKLKKIVVGYTIKVEDHPDSDHLHICQVDVGEENGGQLEIVCGASNVKEGQKVIVALVGARIKDNIKIKRGKIRGVVSNGMLCSLEELGFSTNVIPKEYSNGIYILPEDAPIGSDIVDYLQLDDSVLELSITPNRADALSMYGVAYEVGAIYNQVPQIQQQFEIPYNSENVSDLVKVTIENKDDTPYYAMNIIKNVNIQESPLWLQLKLMNAGIRPINNVVDVTNYMLILYGQPMHAFDFDTLHTVDTKKEISIKKATDNTTLVTLDNVERQLLSSDVIISSNQDPIALAGVMGGLNTEITNQTVNIALETAIFNSRNVRHTAKRLNLKSESSTRYEKGVNTNTVQLAIQHALYLIAKLGNGQVVMNDRMLPVPQKSERISITLEQINKAIGVTLSTDEVINIFNRLQFEVECIDQEFKVTIPPRRWDIKIKADIIEEVARIYGYANIPSTLPITSSIKGGLSVSQQLKRQTRRVLQSTGLSQIISYSLTSKEKVAIFDNETFDNISLAMPMSEERSVLRRSLITNLLEVASYNHARNETDLAIYEMGKVFYSNGIDRQPNEVEKVAILLTGQKTSKSWYSQPEAYTYFDLKGKLEELFKVLGLDVSYKGVQLKNMHPGRTAQIILHEEVIGFIGQIHPQLSNEYDLKDVYVAEIDMDKLCQTEKQQLFQTIIPKYPSMTRDLALLVDETTPHESLMSTIKETAGKYLSTVELFDLYKGNNITAGKKSVAYRLTFLNLEATLVETEVNDALNRVVDSLIEKYGVEVR